jgi:hypothetical protein
MCSSDVTREIVSRPEGCLRWCVGSWGSASAFPSAHRPRCCLLRDSEATNNPCQILFVRFRHHKPLNRSHLGAIKNVRPHAFLSVPFMIAVNKNPKAPTFQAATVGVVADLVEFLPVLTEKVKGK